MSTKRRPKRACGWHDSPTGRLVHRTDVPNGVHPGEGVHVGPNAVVRDATDASVRAFPARVARMMGC